MLGHHVNTCSQEIDVVTLDERRIVIIPRMFDLELGPTANDPLEVDSTQVGSLACVMVPLSNKIDHSTITATSWSGLRGSDIVVVLSTILFSMVVSL